MAIEDREQLVGDENRIILPDFQAEDQAAKMENVLDHQDKDTHYRNFTTPERTHARST
jgi:hypothetical protein